MVEKLKLSKDTKLLISIAARPGHFGTSVFNKVFADLHLDYLYKAFALDSEGDLASVIRAIRALNIRGCGVSMPFKEKVLPLLDRLEGPAAKISAVNTIVNDQGILIGYNTDYSGAYQILKDNADVCGKVCLICGAGGVARAVAQALSDLGGEVFVTGRDAKKTENFAQTMGLRPFSWDQLPQAEGYLLVNATPVGMFPEAEASVVGASVLKNFKIIFDCVADPTETALVKQAKMAGCKTVPGFLMAIEQAMGQFALYTGNKVSREVMETAFLNGGSR